MSISEFIFSEKKKKSINFCGTDSTSCDNFSIV